MGAFKPLKWEKGFSETKQQVRTAVFPLPTLGPANPVIQLVDTGEGIDFYLGSILGMHQVDTFTTWQEAEQGADMLYQGIMAQVREEIKSAQTLKIITPGG